MSRALSRALANFTHSAEKFPHIGSEICYNTERAVNQYDLRIDRLGDPVKRALIAAFANLPKRLTQARIAELLGVPESTVAGWARGHVPRRQHWEALYEHTGIDVGAAMVLDGGGDAVEQASLTQLQLAALVEALSLRLARVEALLEPFLAGDPMPPSPGDAQALARGFGRRLREDRRRPTRQR